MGFGIAHDKPNERDCNSELIPPTADELVTDLRHTEERLVVTFVAVYKPSSARWTADPKLLHSVD
jgi:hypothetical protein